jgi:glycerol-3-phosphate O-acyltransferase
MGILSPLNLVARKILYLAVKAEVLPGDKERLGIDPSLPVVYVLDSRAWSNLLVLEAECDRLGLPLPTSKISTRYLRKLHSIYTVAPKQPFKAWLKKQPKRSKALRSMIKALAEHPEEIIQFVPVSIFWGRPVAKQKHWLKVLFADSWGIAGRTRKFFTILIHGRNTLVNFSEIIKYK